jgi:bifunctional non-homologous end joining protein LigD
MIFGGSASIARIRWHEQPGGERWVQPVTVVELSFAEWTPDGHIRHPKFHGIRDDKPAESIRREVYT